LINTEHGQFHVGRSDIDVPFASNEVNAIVPEKAALEKAHFFEFLNAELGMICGQDSHTVFLFSFCIYYTTE